MNEKYTHKASVTRKERLIKLMRPHTTTVFVLQGMKGRKTHPRSHKHCPCLTLPAFCVVLPVPHEAQTALLSGVFLYVPFAHAVHEPDTEVCPMLHRHSAREAAPAAEKDCDGHWRHTLSETAPTVVEYIPAAQGVQSDGPLRLLYFPAEHWVHAPPLGPSYPFAH